MSIINRTRTCSRCGFTGHNIRTCTQANVRVSIEPPRRRITDDYLREFEHECARRVQTYTPMGFNEFLETEYNDDPNLLITFAMKKCNATRQMSRANIIQLIQDYSVRTYVFGGRDIYEVFGGHSAFREQREREQREREREQRILERDIEQRARERENQELFDELPEIVEEEENRNLLTEENAAEETDPYSHIRSMAYALRSDMLAFTLIRMFVSLYMPQLDGELGNVLDEVFTGQNMNEILQNNPDLLNAYNNGFNNARNATNLNILTKVNNDENEDIHQLCECSICYDEKQVKEYVKYGCGHEFCSTCVSNTIKSRRTGNKLCCAMCRSEVTEIQCRTNEVKAEIDNLIK